MKAPEKSVERQFYFFQMYNAMVFRGLELSKTTLILGSHILGYPEM